MEKLESAELLTTKPSAGMSAEDEAKNESFTASLTNRIVDNVQITVKNVHLRYEDNVSVPSHPFSIGITLAGFTASSTDKSWLPTFIHNSKEGIHKLANLDSLAIYFDSDSKSLAGHPADQAIQIFNQLIAKADSDDVIPDHQYILRPVSGEGRLVLNNVASKDTPKTDAELLFKELAFTLDEYQYRDALSMLDLFHFYTRQNRYRKYRPPQKQLEQNKNRALFKFAQEAILQEVKERHRKWTWDYFRQRRDDRKLYVYAFKLDARGEASADVGLSALRILMESNLKICLLTRTKHTLPNLNKSSPIKISASIDQLRALNSGRSGLLHGKRLSSRIYSRILKVKEQADLPVPPDGSAGLGKAKRLRPIRKMISLKIF